jgi:hypothetical protein
MFAVQTRGQEGDELRLDFKARPRTNLLGYVAGSYNDGRDVENVDELESRDKYQNRISFVSSPGPD